MSDLRNLKIKYPINDTPIPRCPFCGGKPEYYNGTGSTPDTFFGCNLCSDEDEDTLSWDADDLAFDYEEFREEEDDV